MLNMKLVSVLSCYCVGCFLGLHESQDVVRSFNIFFQKIFIYHSILPLDYIIYLGFFKIKNDEVCMI